MIPQSLRTPGNYFDISAAPTPFNSKNKQLLFGNMIEAGGTMGTATIDTPVLCTKSTIDLLFGAKSMLAAMYRKASTIKPFQEIWAVPLLAVGVAMSGSITVADASTNLGQSIFYIAGERISVEIQSGETNDDVAANIANIINASSVCVDATVALSVVTLTCVHKGGLSVSLALDVVGDEGSVGKNTLTFSGPALAGGNGAPDESTALLNLGEEEYDFLTTPFNDTSNLDRMRDFLDARWGYDSQLYGQCVTATSGTVGELSAIGLARNDKYITNLGTSDSVSPVWEWAAAYGVILASHLGDAPELSRPLQGLVLEGLRLPKTIFDQSERNVLLYDGIATFKKNPGGQVLIDRAITMYRLTDEGNADASWLDTNTLAQVMYFVRYQHSRLSGTFNRMALADSNPNNLKTVVTVEDIRQNLIQGYMRLMKLAVCENIDKYEELLTVARSGNDSNRVDIGIDADWVNQLMVMAISVKSHLQIEG
ncbi:MAG: phage tail sheath subtilisin-like domain-containing protein [Rhizobiales bacterium]|nr:phage tail sheath subtilisin-like domain-containing protein [Hyphomicrobiales bacterium]NRB13104.1 phage tail sheath subtilisin-like domain-containing protein [Hyphomicrobiales bacterium]